MKLRRILPVLLIMFATTIAVAQSEAQKSFDKLKTLAGSWEGKASNGQPGQVDFRVTSGGSAIISEIKGSEDMVTMFHLDGGRLLMTHYCAAGNQPRMKGSMSPDGKTMTFDFVDATNLASSEEGHMHHVVFTFVDANHHSEEWTFLDHGKEMKETFELVRKN
ncbi:MAG TPA: hypothetical protein VMT28_00265 [Terriglobales bacterium]|jgi:hypothetical protein|nr:hypothetical protein [Terriglobales bacterium]